MPLANPADGGVAGKFTERGFVLGDEECSCAGAGGCGGGFGSGVSSSDDDYVVGGGGEGVGLEELIVSSAP